MPDPIYQASHRFGRQLCEALGLDPARVKRVVIDCDAESVVTVYVQGFVTGDQCGAVLAAARELPADARCVRKVGVDERGFVKWMDTL